MPSISLPSSSPLALRLLLYPRFLFIMSNTRASSSNEICSIAALARRRYVSKVVLFPCSERMLSLEIKPASVSTSINSCLLNLYRCRLRRMLRFRVRSAFVVILLPFSKFCSSSTVSGLTRTPNFMIDDFSSVFSASLTKAQPILLTPKSRPKIFFIVINFYIATNI